MPIQCDTLTVIEEPAPDIEVTAVEITVPTNKTVYPEGAFSFKVTVTNSGNAMGDVDVKLSCDSIEVSGSPITIENVPAGGNKDKTVPMTAPSTTGSYQICAEEVKHG